MMTRRSALVAGTVLAASALGFGGWRIARDSGAADYEAAVAAARARLSEHPRLIDFVRLATLAPNGHNTQPWRFRLGDGRIDVLPDLARRTPVVDPDDHHMFVSLGCAAETLAIAAAAGGYRGEVSFAPADDGSVVFAFGSGPTGVSPLLAAITQRQSTRSDYDARPVGAVELRALAEAARVPGVDLMLLTDRGQIDRVRDFVAAGNTAQMADAAFLRELKSWLRFNPHQALATGDGLYSATTGNPTAPAWLGGLLFDLMFSPASENDKYARQLRGSAGVAVFVSEHADKDHWVRAGRACQRFLLQATALGLKQAFINQPVEVPAVRDAFAAYLGTHGRRPDLVLRFGYGPDMPKSLRRPVTQVVLEA